MQLYVEADFLIDFEILFEENRYHRSWRVLYQIFTEFTDIQLIIDCEGKLINDSYFYNRLTDLNPKTQEVGEFNQFFSSKSSLPNQTLILTTKKLQEYHKIMEMGGLQFTLDSFPEEIEVFIETYEREFDFSDPKISFKWSDLSFLSTIPFRSLVINDSYVLVDNPKQRILENLIPLLRTLLEKKNDKSYVTIFSMEFMNHDETRKRIEERVAVKKRHQFIQSQLSNNIKRLCFVKNDITKGFYDQHDRYIYTPFCIISCGKGFNLFPFKSNNSDIKCSTFFHKATYRKLQNHYKNLKEVVERLDRQDVISNKLKFYPNKESVNLFLD